MVRPRKRRMVNFEPQVTQFKPEGLKEDNLEEVILTADELEAMRLSFLESLTQIEAATSMDIHQSTFQRTLKRALIKISEAFVYGKSVRIEGEYKMPGGDGNGPYGKGSGMGRNRENRRKCRNRRNASEGSEGTCICPACGYEVPHKSGVPCAEVKCEKCETLMVRK